MMIEFNKEMLRHLVCPLTGGALQFLEPSGELYCQLSQMAYPIRDGVPVLRYDQARECLIEEK
ncbi:Trm112 family protein [Candidatus Synchoanobacter obligatus]|uniref:Trm112 family protein n=1 Tax=Candidatus Synchoanobacter obligatus TaxID=2919597 RepID=A0ABT1L6K7_9GAMM|nr:Trm112 family protein [Candidatus Synchoanobacter obligatus]MCP8352078.1 Trm112 family protein [Candidatus Synchoanobacter obligatus]